MQMRSATPANKPVPSTDLFERRPRRTWPFHVQSPERTSGERRQAESRGRSLEFAQTDYKYTRLSEWRGRNPSHAMLRSWSSPGMVTKPRLWARTVSYALCNGRGLLESITRILGIPSCVHQSA